MTRFASFHCGDPTEPARVSPKPRRSSPPRPAWRARLPAAGELGEVVMRAKRAAFGGRRPSPRACRRSPSPFHRMCGGNPLLGTDEGRAHARQERARQEREAVRGAEGQGHVQGAGRKDRQLARRVEPRWEGVAQLELEVQLLAGRDDRPEEGGRPQGRQGGRRKALARGRKRVTRSRVAGVRKAMYRPFRPSPPTAARPTKET